MTWLLGNWDKSVFERSIHHFLGFWSLCSTSTKIFIFLEIVMIVTYSEVFERMVIVELMFSMNT